MSISSILESIDAEIETLQAARAALSNGTSPKKPAGRPKGSKNEPNTIRTKVNFPKRNLTPEGRKKIAEAVKKRWRLAKKAKKATQELVEAA